MCVYISVYVCAKFYVFSYFLVKISVYNSGTDGVVGIATGYGLDGPGIKSRWGQGFPQLSRPALGPPSHLYNGYRIFQEGKERPGRDADPSPLLVPWS
jgi:hypothetical protein